MDTRRDVLKYAFLGGAGLAAPGRPALAASATAGGPPPVAAASPARWGVGFEGQRIADRGDGLFLNPVMAGDHPDPTILKDGADYYMTFTSFEAYPGLVLWHSRDLVNWQPIGPALSKPLGSVFAVDLCKHSGRYFIYVPVYPTSLSTIKDGQARIYVIHADRVEGPWSEPVDLGIVGYIDPGHVVGEDGRRYLFLSGVGRVRLRDDGLATDGPIEHVYDGWQYPEEWIVEAFALEGPKVFRRGEWFYLVSAVGGTAGPPTGHMVIAARSRSIHGPWENAPHNPVVRTRDANERWWSRGHASLVEGPDGSWWMVYHGFENGYRTLGRQMLLEPVEWTPDGWFRATGGDLSTPLRKPRGGTQLPHGIAKSDDFAAPAFGTRWSFYQPGLEELARARFEDGALVLAGKGTSPLDCSPLAALVGDQAYEVSVDLELVGSVEGGLLLFYSSRLFCGMGHDGRAMATYRSGMRSFWAEPAPEARRIRLKIVNDRHIITAYYSADGVAWTRHGLRMETSGYHTNTADELVSLRPALFACGQGRVRFRDFRYRALA